MRWTEEQQKVIDERGSNILVSAAAGSGKTAVLCERILSRLVDENAPMSLDRLLVMTFTNAAAEEMKERISSGLKAKLQEKKRQLAEASYGEERSGVEAVLERLRHQELLLRDADISTIDSLCSRLIRDYYQEIDIDPGFRTAEEGELKLIREDVLRDLLEEKYAEADESFMSFAEALSSRRSDEKLSKVIEDTYDFIQSDPWPRHFLARMLRETESEKKGDYEALPWFSYFMDRSSRDCREYSLMMEDCMDVCREEDGPAAYLPAAEELHSFFQRLGQTKDYKELRDLLNGFTPQRLKAVREKDADPVKKDGVKRCIEMARKYIKGLAASVPLSTELLQITTAGSASYISSLIQLTESFMDRFSAAKKERNIVDFDDMEHLCLSLLYDEDGEKLMPSAIADELSRQYDEILVDEYQDSNLVQEAIIYALSGERFGHPDVFMVGDVKQSIYRFRLARPELFMSKYRSYGEPGREAAESGGETIESGGKTVVSGRIAGESKGVRIDLNKNFRSRKAVLDAVNSVFSVVMQRELGGIEYDEAARLYPGAEYKDEGDEAYRAELSILDLPEEGSEEASEGTDELEARLIAERIKELMGEGTATGLKLTSPEGSRRLSYRDIVILLRAPGSRAQTYVDVLSSQGIPAYTEATKGYFSSVEVETVLSFLSIIDNPRQDIALAAVMRSVIGGFSDEDLARLRSEDISQERSVYTEAMEDTDQDDVYEARARDIQDTGLYGLYDSLLSTSGAETDLGRKCSDFIKLLNSFRRLSEILSVSRLIDRIYNSTGYYDHVRLLPMGHLRIKNLDMLLQRAETYAAAGESSLFDFVRYIELIRSYDTDYGEAGESEAADLVRIMSIHKSKGLEYPVVILANAQKQFNREDTRADILMDSELGMGADHIDTEQRIRYPGLKKTAIKLRTTEESLAEELRILYVAMTRAREKLIVTGAVKNAGSRIEKYGSMSILRKEGAKAYVPELMAASSMLDVLLMSGACQGGSIKLRISSIPELSDRELMRELDRREDIDRLLEADIREIRDPGYTQAVISGLEFVYPYERETRLRPKLSVSELRNGEAEDYAGRAGLDDEIVEEDLFVSRLDALEAGSSVKGRDEGSSYGTLLHRFFELLDLAGFYGLAVSDIRESVEKEKSAGKDKKDKQACMAEFIDKERERMAASGLLSSEELQRLDARDISSFLGSGLAAEMAEAAAHGRLKREQRFMALFPADVLDPLQGSSAPQILQGIVDAFYERPDGSIVIVDYKTDHLYDEAAFRKRYGRQLELYRMSLEKLLGKEGISAVIFSTAMKKAISCTN